MARSHGRIKVEIWLDEDFRALTASAQRVYLLLISQPKINNCGVLPYVPRRWAKFASGTSVEDLGADLDELERHRFIVTDPETEEVVVRTFIRHDRIERQPNLLKAAKAEFLQVESREIRQTLREEYPHLFDPNGQTPLFSTGNEGVPEDLPEGVPEGVPGERGSERGSERSRARTAPAPTPTRESTSSALSLRRDHSKQATPPAAAQKAAPLGGADELPQEVAFREANRFVVTSEGWRDGHLEQTLRREWPELIEEDVGSLLATAEEMRDREVA